MDSFIVHISVLQSSGEADSHSASQNNYRILQNLEFHYHFHLRQRATRPYPEPDESSPHPHNAFNYFYTKRLKGEIWFWTVLVWGLLHIRTRTGLHCSKQYWVLQNLASLCESKLLGLINLFNRRKYSSLCRWCRACARRLMTHRYVINRFHPTHEINCLKSMARFVWCIYFWYRHPFVSINP
jgi:hypothetical protein